VIPADNAGGSSESTALGGDCSQLAFVVQPVGGTISRRKRVWQWLGGGARTPTVRGMAEAVREKPSSEEMRFQGQKTENVRPG